MDRAVPITFRNKKTEKTFNKRSDLIHRYGPVQAKLIILRKTQLEAAEMQTLPQVRAHELKGDRAGQISLDLIHPKRLLIVPDHEKTPRKPDGGLDWTKITRIMIIGMEDTHD
jgi:plasmid maintenance system killer protein